MRKRGKVVCSSLGPPRTQPHGPAGCTRVTPWLPSAVTAPARQADLRPLSHPVLIRLEKKGERCAVRSQFVQPICLPEPSSPFPAGHKCQIAGWGHQDESEFGQGARVMPPGAVAQPSLSTPTPRVGLQT